MKVSAPSYRPQQGWATTAAAAAAAAVTVQTMILLVLPTTSLAAFLVRDTPVSYVMEPFESIDNEWTIYDEAQAFDYTILNGGGEEEEEDGNGSSLFGNGTLQVEQLLPVEGEGQVASTTFGWPLANRTHNCYGASEISIWYKADVSADNNAPRLKVTLLDDSFCMNSASFGIPILPKYQFCQSFTDEVTLFEIGLESTSDFQELRLDVSTLGGGIDLTRIRGWQIKIEGTAFGDKVWFDQLACHGDGYLLGAVFHTDRTLQESVEDGSWLETYFYSELAENSTTRTLGDGTLTVDYLLQQVEAWGGFNDYSHLAPGSAYYNLSQATDLVIEYDVLQVASIPGRAIFRMVLQDNSHCIEDCDIDYHKHERWYTFNSILDEEGPGTVAIPFVASTDPSTPFWLTGWSGILGDEDLSLDEIKGFALELVLDSGLEIGDTLTGAVAFRNMAAAYSTEVIDSDVVYVIEPFESLDESNHTEIVMTPRNDLLTLNATLSSEEDAFIGNHSLQITFDVSNDSAVADGRWILQDRPHNCHGAEYFTFWYKSLQPGVRMRLQMFDDSECSTADGADDDDTPGSNCAQVGNLDRYGIFNDELTGDGEWHEATIQTTLTDGLNLARIRGFSMVFLEGAGTVFIDQFACAGGGSMLSSVFHIDPSQTLRDAVAESTWLETYYNSNTSRDETISSLNDGILSIDYTVEQRESWGGFLDFSHLAPGNAYYNLTKATDLSLNYVVNKVNSIPGRAIFRFVLQDNSDCVEGCSTDYHKTERWYSFNAILDEPGRGQIFIPLVGSEEPSTPFWLPGWSGILGDRELSVEEIKGFAIEIVLDSVLDLGDLVTGSVDFFDFEAVQTDFDEEDDSEFASQCVEENNLDFYPEYSGFKITEFLAAECCEVCEEDPECNYALIVGRDCYTATFIEANYVGLVENDMVKEDRTAIWMDDVAKRGDFCDRCVCRPDLYLIDCQGQDLVILPKTFNETWAPRILDIQANPRLVVVGAGSLNAIAESLEEIRLPSGMKHIAPKSLLDLPKLSSIDFEGDGEDVESDHNLANAIAIAKPTEFFDHVCCSAGSVLELVSEGSDTNSLTFCKLQLHEPGIDSVYEPFINYDQATVLDIITPSSKFMSEAAESVEKCAEFCSINDECQYFGYDARLPNAEHLCYHLSDNAGPIRVCCTEDHFADEAKQIPGWVSGRPPQTRHDVDNAKVVYSSNSLEVATTNDFQASYEVSLGSTPLRGAVWVETVMVTEFSGLDVTIQPSRLVLYDESQTATVTVTVHDVTPDSPSVTVIIRNRIESCDEAFTVTDDSDENLVYVTVDVPEADPEAEEERNLGLIIGLPVAFLFLVGLGVFLFYENKRKENDAVWQVNKQDLVFADPPEIAGRGTFGMVLLAEYRGTQVAVKRVLPPRSNRKGKGGNTGTSSGMGTSSGVGTSSGMGTSSGVGMSSWAVFGAQSGSSLDKSFQSKSQRTTSSGSNLNGPRRSSLDHKSNPGMESGASWARPSEGSKTGYQRTTAIGYGSPDDAPSTNTKKSGIFNVFAGGTFRYSHSNDKSRKILKADFMEEMRIMSKLRHPCVTTVMGAVIGKNDDPMLVMEYMEHGSLYDILHNETMPIDSDLLLPILRDISQGMRFLHSSTPQVLHGDLKAANILVDSKFRAKVADFGLSQKKHLGGTGTPFWMAPELLRQESTNSAATDVYSFGIILYEVYSRKDPYDGEDAREVLRLVSDKKISKRPPVPENCPAQISSLMTDCIVEDADKRPTFDEVDTRLKRIDAALIDESSRTKNTAISLFDIFPKHIAEALRDGKTVDPEHREVATIFFSDIVGFTSISSKLPPRKIASLLDRLYTKFDALSQKHDIFKVETIGDAYMAVTNLVKDQKDDHCKRIAQFAIDAVAAANGTLIDLDDEDKGFVNIRVGFHSGSIVADVVGTRNPRYCLFGDAVNTASRMESNSKANRIHCSNKSAAYLISQCPEIPLKSRGHIPIKGKGEMETFWVNNTPFATSRPSPSSKGAAAGKMETLPELDRTEVMTADTTTPDSSDSGNGTKDDDLEAQLNGNLVPVNGAET